MELTYLYYFKVIAEKENMSRAAETLHVSQPALSKTISKLEQSLGVTLFERKKGRISLSPIGSEFYRQVSKAFDCIDEGQRIIDAYKKAESNTVTIGSPVSDLLNTLILSYMNGQHDGLQISQFLYSPEALQEQLLGGKLDFALTPIPFHDPEITQIKLMDEEIILAVGRSHPLAKQSFVRLEDCKNERFLVNEASFDRRAVTDNCKAVGFTPIISLCSNEPRIIDEALESGRGVSMVPANVFYEKFRADNPVVGLRFSDIEVFRFISIVSRKDRTLMDQPKKLYNFAVGYFEEYGRKLQDFLDCYFPPADFGPRKCLGLNREENIGVPDPADRTEEHL